MQLTVPDPQRSSVLIWNVGEQWFSHFNLHGNHLEGLLNHGMQSFVSRVSGTAAWDSAWTGARLTTANGQALETEVIYNLKNLQGFLVFIQMWPQV